MLDKTIVIQRLARIKYLYKLGMKLTEQSDYAAMFSILNFQDCAELFLGLAAENENVNTDKLSFIQYWEKIPKLTQKESLRRLNYLRVQIKHKGFTPSREDINTSKVVIGLFLQESCKEIFGIDFEKVSLCDLVEFSKCKEHLKDAENWLIKGDLFNSLLESKLAFLIMLDEYEDNKKVHYRSPFSVGTFISSDFKKLVSDNKDGKRWFEQVTESLENLQHVVKLLSLQLDMRKYTYFNLITPIVKKRGVKGMPLEYQLAEVRSHFEDTHKTTKSHCEFCINFVIDSALHLQSFDFNTDIIFK